MKIKTESIVIGLSCFVLILIAVPISWYKYTGVDEGWQMSEAYTLIHSGRIAPPGMGTYLDFDKRPLYLMPERAFMNAISFVILGTGIFQARIISILFAMGVIILSFQIAKKFFGNRTAFITLFLLFFFRSGIENAISGVPLIDFGCSARYDIDEAFWVLLSLYFFLKALDGLRNVNFILAGSFAAIAFLSHIYALLLLFAYMVYFISEKKLFHKSSFLLFASVLFVLLPQLIWIISNFEGFRQRMDLFYDRGNFFSATFYYSNLKNEWLRYFAKLQQDESFAKYLLLPFMLFSLYFLYREIKKNKSAQISKLFIIFFSSVIVLLAFFDSTKVGIYFSSVFTPLNIVVAAFIAKAFESSGTILKKSLIISFFALMIADGSSGIFLKFKKTFEKENQYRVFEFLQQHVKEDSSVLTFSHFWYPFRTCHFNEFARLGFEFRQKKDSNVSLSDSANLRQILCEINPEYIIFFGGFDNWAQFFARPYGKEFLKVWNSELETNFSLDASRVSNIYGEVLVYRKKNQIF